MLTNLKGYTIRIYLLGLERQNSPATASSFAFLSTPPVGLLSSYPAQSGAALAPLFFPVVWHPSAQHLYHLAQLPERKAHPADVGSFSRKHLTPSEKSIYNRAQRHSQTMPALFSPLPVPFPSRCRFQHTSCSFQVCIYLYFLDLPQLPSHSHESENGGCLPHRCLKGNRHCFLYWGEGQN